jgi:hypothetical protein
MKQSVGGASFWATRMTHGCGATASKTTRQPEGQPFSFLHPPECFIEMTFSTPNLRTLKGVCLSCLLSVASVIANAQSTRVHLKQEATYSQTISAIRDNQQTSVELRTIRVRVVDRAGKVREFTPLLVYDPQSKLFFWDYFEAYQDYSPDFLAKQFLSTVYLAPDKLVIFTSSVIHHLAISESTERDDSLDQAQDNVVHFFEKEPLPSYRSEFKSVDYLKEMPRDFLKQCMTDINMPPRIVDLQRQGKQWRLRVRAQNGNVADIVLDDSYNLVSTKFTVNPAADALGGCSR